ncbi:MAG: phosphoglucosamine mutase [Candidatus Neomarinimicrobiota bacterium]|nr:MAG: phosphoglucosamine mutase [Candidatus Neomarinimicrobiota bacterium]
MLIRSISGVRGLTATRLTTDTVRRYVRAVHLLLPAGPVLLGRDTRPSGELLLSAAAEELLRLGRHVISCGIVPTPTVQFMTETTEAVGGIILTASHNPIEWNGLKFVRGDGTFFYPHQCEELFRIFDENPDPPPATSAGLFWAEQNALQKHVIRVVERAVDRFTAIRQRKFKVVIDAVNGAGSQALPLLLESLGCEVVPLYCDGTGDFLRGAEPLPENLGDLGRVVREQRADAGFAVDPDADRLAVVDETGTPLGEEYTLVLAADGYIRSRQTPETLVTNLSTSLALEKLAESRGWKVERSAVGEINVVQKMIALKANLGGEGNGGVILKAVHLGRDSLVGAAMVLQRLALEEQPLSGVFRSLPQYSIVKDRLPIQGIAPEELLNRIAERFPEAGQNREDGLKLSWPDSWVHIRASNTEPILRMYGEAPTEPEARELIRRVRAVL